MDALLMHKKSQKKKSGALRASLFTKNNLKTLYYKSVLVITVHSLKG
jgi:hypothetical protein